MSANVALYSSHQITEEKLAEVIRQAGGVLTPGSPASYFGGFIDGDAHIWTKIIPCYDGVFDYEGKPLDEDDIVLLDQAKVILGGEFETWILSILEIDLAVSGWLCALPIPAASTGHASWITMKGDCFHVMKSSNCINKMEDLLHTDYNMMVV